MIDRTKMTLIQELETVVNERWNKTMKACSSRELYESILILTKEMILEQRPIYGTKKVYYISAEFLIGKLLSNNLINLGLYDVMEDILRGYGHSVAEIEECEPEPSLGNGGLGRLAACFLDSIATLGLPGEGIGLNYHYGLFKQTFEDYKQYPVANDWIEEPGWLVKTQETYTVEFGNMSLKSELYQMDVVGYGGQTIKLSLFDTSKVNEQLVTEGITFDKTAIQENLTLFLYPDDSDTNGHLLRIYQQYFMVSSAAQRIIEEVKQKEGDLHHLDDYAVIQINDTHPTMIIPELIRLLGQEGIGFDEAVDIVRRTCAYTNHTILSEALEKWPMEYLEEVVPSLVPIIKELDQRVKSAFRNENVWIIDPNERVHMAHLAIHYGFSVNGVAAIHTDILKKSELNDFYRIYPDKFNNKTNGITFRRWLLSCNRPLTEWIRNQIGDSFIHDATRLEELLEVVDDEGLQELEQIKADNKQTLTDYIYEKEGIEIDPNAIFDIQIKRLHEYKRQQMNALYIIHKYLEIKKGIVPKRPLTFIFGAKAAPAYTTAKDIIHLLLVMQALIQKDAFVRQHMQVIIVENYNVSYAEKLIPACDISEQISLASKEASGTGNMKLMLNGAITLGTLDGANIEIRDLVGEENMFIFGKEADTVLEIYNKESYNPLVYYESSPALKEAVDFIVSKTLQSMGDASALTRLYKELLTKDYFMTFLDFDAYVEIKEKAFEAYEHRGKWMKMCLHNIAKAGYFSSDRTIEDYNKEIWKLMDEQA